MKKDRQDVFLIFLIVLICLSNYPAISSQPSIIPNQVVNEINSVYVGSSINDSIQINFWSANENKFPINKSKIFPMTALGSGGSFANLGSAWIVWSIEIDNKLLIARATYNKGRSSQLEIIGEYYDEIYWNSIQNNLFLVGISAQSSDFYWYSSIQGLILSDTINYHTSNHQIFVTNTNNLKISFLINNTTPFVYEANRITQLLVESDEKQISSFPGIGGIYVLKNGSIELRSSEIERVIPTKFTNQSRLGHHLLNPVVFDLSINEAILYPNPLNPIPINMALPNDTIKIFDLGLSSSIIQTSNNSFYEYTTTGWKLLTKLSNGLEIEDFTIVDIGLYYATSHRNGLKIIPIGPDFDGDFVPDTMEDYYSSFPDNIDSDSDTIPDGVEAIYGMNLIQDDRKLDSDFDNIINIDELNMGLDPLNRDSDFGGAHDGWEIKYDFDPLNLEDDLLDNDLDGLTNDKESIWNINPYEKDTDGDKMPDNWEVRYQLDPLDPTNGEIDFDGDGRTNYREYLRGTDPLIPDPPDLFEGLYVWIILMMIIGIPISFRIWRSYIRDELPTEDKIEEEVVHEELIE